MLRENSPRVHYLRINVRNLLLNIMGNDRESAMIVNLYSND